MDTSAYKSSRGIFVKTIQKLQRKFIINDIASVIHEIVLTNVIVMQFIANSTDCREIYLADYVVNNTEDHNLIVCCLQL